MARVWAEINCRNWLHNLGLFRRQAAPASVVPVVKSDAYGLGARQAVRVFTEGGVERVAVATVEEARDLADMPVEIQFLGVPEKGEIPEIVENGWIGSVGDTVTAQMFSDAAVARNRGVRVHILVDTGMGRLGFLPCETAREAARAAVLPGVEVEGIYSHFPAAENKDEFAFKQIERMRDLWQNISSTIDIRHCHMANSYAIAALPSSFEPPFTMVRPGIELHGVSDEYKAALSGIKPVVALKSRLIAVRKLPAGSTVGYGRTFRAENDLLVGTVPVGYADGYPRSLSNAGEVLVRGKRCRVIGSVCMDYIQVALDDAPDAQKDDEVVVAGRQGDEIITLNELAEKAGTITYELLTGLGPRVERRYQKPAAKK